MTTITTQINETVITMTFPGEGEITFDIRALSLELQQQAMLHGIKQKLGDAAAKSRDTETGLPVSMREKMDAVRAVAERLRAGEWNAKRGEGKPKGNQLLNALMAVYPNKTEEELSSWLATKSDADKAALRKVPTIAAEIARAKAESGKIAEESLLDGLLDSTPAKKTARKIKE